MVLIRTEGNIFWQLLRLQKDSVQMRVMEELKDRGIWRNFQDYQSHKPPEEMKYGVIICEIFHEYILPYGYKQKADLSTFKQIERYYEDLKPINV